MAAKLLTGNDLNNLREVGSYTFNTETVTNKYGFSQLTVTNRSQYQPMEITNIEEVRYVQLVVVSSSGDSGNDQYASLGDINFYGTDFNVKKETLKSAIDDANSKVSDNYTADSFANLQNVVTNAQNVYDNADVKQVVVDDATSKVLEAIEDLEAKQDVNKDALSAKLEEAKNADKEGKTDDSVAALDKAISDAEAIIAKDDATQDEVDDACEALEEAMANLKDAVDKSALEDALDDAKTLDQSKLSEESAKVLDDAIKAAESVIANDDATQDDVDQAKADLDAAVKQIEINLPFIDVVKKDWFYKVVCDAYFEGLMGATGKGPEYFEPNLNISRGMVATVLYRMAGLPKVTFAVKFPDVNKESMWYAKAITWASSDSIKVVSGYGNGTFGPDDNIKRQDLAIMLRNYAKMAGLDTTAKADLTIFMDDQKVDGYAKSAIEWCVANKIMSGSKQSDGDYLNPTEFATRAECAKMFTLLQDLCE